MKALLLSSALLFTVSVSCQQKRALIVAIGQYPTISRIRPIAALGDIRLVKNALFQQGFPGKNIDTLINEQATKAGILQALSALASRSSKGDIVVIHFSCHGQQIRDQRTVELGKDEDDGYDEALVAYDARAQYSPTGYKGENHLRDDDLHVALNAIQRKIGPSGSILVLLDACHSGTGTRSSDFAVSRGEPVPFNDPENPLEELVEINDKDSFFDDGPTDSLANLITMSGAGPHQLNFQLRVDGHDVGSLSYAFYKAMSELPAGSTYADLFGRMRAIIQAGIPEQLPILEGNTSQLVFSGRYAKTTDKITIRVGLGKRSNNDSLFTIDKGSMDELNAGTTGEVWLGDKFITTAVLRKTGSFSSIGQAGMVLQRDQVYEFKPGAVNYGPFSAKIRLTTQASDTHATGLAKQFSGLTRSFAFIKIAPDGDLLADISKVATGERIALSDRNGRALWSSVIPVGDTLNRDQQKELLEAIKRSTRITYIRNLPDGGSLSKYIDVQLIPAGSDSSEGTPVLKAGDHYFLQLQNNSQSKLFYTVLDILPDNSIDVLYPYKDKDASNYSIGAGATVRRELGISRDPLAGKELLKVIFSKEPMDLRSVFARKKERGDRNSFQWMLNDLFKDEGVNATRADVSNISVEDIGIITTGFIIYPEKK